MLDTFDEIRNDINDRMSKYSDSRHPDGDEVAIVWLVGEIERMRVVVRRAVKTLNSMLTVVDKVERGSIPSEILNKDHVRTVATIFMDTDLPKQILNDVEEVHHWAIMVGAVHVMERTGKLLDKYAEVREDEIGD